MAPPAGRPPALEGFTYVESIGAGGFADVYLYQQAMPSRRVAVKVLRESADGDGRALFEAEANVMAQLSGHPSIVPIYQAGVSGDGRPYLVMEYCPPPHLASRFRTERIPVPEVLETGVRVASAAETAHRAGILHRDIKPLNILTSAYGSPMLSDFGIAAATGEVGGGAGGMSVPWSPPEAFLDDAPADPRSDVFSIGATIYSLLAGRSPFEVPGGANDSSTLMSRIERQPLTRVNRADVPDSLNRVLARAMAKRVEDRYPSAMAFARACQEVQIELHISPTRVEVLDAAPSVGGAVDDDERTRVRPVSIIVPEALAETGTRLRPVVISPTDDAGTRPGPLVGSAATDQTQVRAPAAAAPAPDTVSRREPAVADRSDGSHFLDPAAARPDLMGGHDAAQPSRVKAWVGGAVALVLVVVVGLSLALGDGQETAKDPGLGDDTATADVVVGGDVPAPRLSQRRTGEDVVVSWVTADPQPGDSFRVIVEKDGGTTTTAATTKLSRRLDVPAGEAWRVTVKLVRSNAQGSPPSNALLVVGR